MTENETIEIHIAENIHRIEVIENCMHTMPDADKETCKKNIKILTTVNGLLQEIQQYRAIGTVEELKTMKENGAFSGAELAQICAMQMKLKKYQSIGTVEECKASADKMKPKKLSKMFNEYVGVCECGATAFDSIKYCSNCGQAIDWS